MLTAPLRPGPREPPNLCEVNVQPPDKAACSILQGFLVNEIDVEACRFERRNLCFSRFPVLCDFSCIASGVAPAETAQGAEGATRGAQVTKLPCCSAAWPRKLQRHSTDIINLPPAAAAGVLPAIEHGIIIQNILHHRMRSSPLNQ